SPIVAPERSVLYWSCSCGSRQCRNRRGRRFCESDGDDSPLYVFPILWEKESEMVAMKKSAMLLALMTLMVFGSSMAQAQTTGLVSCTATAVPPVVRAEGIAELVGVVVLACITTNSAQFTPG